MQRVQDNYSSMGGIVRDPIREGWAALDVFCKSTRWSSHSIGAWVKGAFKCEGRIGIGLRVGDARGGVIS